MRAECLILIFIFRIQNVTNDSSTIHEHMFSRGLLSNWQKFWGTPSLQTSDSKFSSFWNLVPAAPCLPSGPCHRCRAARRLRARTCTSPRTRSCRARRTTTCTGLFCSWVPAKRSVSLGVLFVVLLRQTEPGRVKKDVGSNLRLEFWLA